MLTYVATHCLRRNLIPFQPASSGPSLHEEYPQIAGEVEDEDDSVLLGVLKGDHIDAFFNYLEYECDDAFVTVKSFVKEAKRILPYLRIDKSVDEWIKEH